MASVYRLPAEVLELDRLDRGAVASLAEYGFLSGQGWLWVLSNNLRAMAAATLLGGFSFGVLAVILLMAPVGIVGYFAGNIALAGNDVGRFLAALVLPHAVLEIPAALIGGAAILQLGLIAINPPQGRTLGQNLLLGLAEWARLFLGLVVPLLAGAAALEVFVTPRIALMLLQGM
jgi:uncharacterized membrane protein SpoIIM required for sporulation